MPEHPYRTIIFDCDSTLCSIEGVDELARMKGCDEEVSALTEAAMDGTVPIESIYCRRLDIICPERNELDWLADRYAATIVDGVAEVFDILHQAGKHLHIVSGGFRLAVRRVAELLSIPPGNIHAVDLYFDERGAYSGFDDTSPLVRSGGKAVIAAGLISDLGPAAAVGDGITDLDMKSAGATVVGFGGVVIRDRVRREADHFVGGPSLRDVLPYLLTSDELDRGLDTRAR